MACEKMVFLEERNGYDKEQVDSYIARLSEAYQAAYDGFQEMREKYNRLSEECDRLDVQKRTGINSDILAKTMVHTEMLAQRIIADAHAEAASSREKAEKMLVDAGAEIGRANETARQIVDGANAEIDKANETAQKIIDGTNAEIEKASETAQKIIDEAHAEAASILSKAKRKFDLAQMAMGQAAKELQMVLTTNTEVVIAG